MTATHGVLTIQAERHEDQAARHHSEFRYGSYARSIALPAAACEDRIWAIYSHGVLKVTAELEDAPQQAGHQIRVMVDHHIDPT